MNTGPLSAADCRGYRECIFGRPLGPESLCFLLIWQLCLGWEEVCEVVERGGLPGLLEVPSVELGSMSEASPLQEEAVQL